MLGCTTHVPNSLQEHEQRDCCEWVQPCYWDDQGGAIQDLSHHRILTLSLRLTAAHLVRTFIHKVSKIICDAKQPVKKTCSDVSPFHFKPFLSLKSFPHLKPQRQRSSAGALFSSAKVLVSDTHKE
jgi:hypothetical protein